METIKAVLQKYGATLSDAGFIVKNGKETSVKPVIKGKRLRFESPAGALLMSGPITEKSVVEFVEKFWFWEPI